jgi:AraC family transcriptional activator of pobA
MIRKNQDLKMQERNNTRPAPTPILQLLEFIKQNFHRQLSVEECSKVVNMSPNYVCRVFKEVTGKTLTEYINIIRVNKAAILLKETGASITEVAAMVGFGSITYFGRVFRKYKNHPPSYFRKY